MIDYGLFMMIYKPSKLIYSSVHIDCVYHFIRDHFSRIPLYTDISFNGPTKPKVGRYVGMAISVPHLLRGRYLPPPPEYAPGYVYLFVAKLFILLEGKMQKVKTKYKKGGRKRKHFKDKLKTNLIFQK